MVQRRRILFGTLAALASRSLMAMPILNTQVLKNPVDVIIVGGGGAGLAAACAAAGNGLRHVIVLEKEPLLGGASVRCEGIWSLAGTAFQAQSAIHDSPEILFRDLMGIGLNANEPALVRAYVSQANAQYDWVRSLGVEPSEIITTSGTSVPRGHRFNPIKVFALMVNRAKELGVTLLTNAPVRKLIYDDKGAVYGVQAQIGGKTETIHSTHGVILATGGFSRNERWIRKFAPKMVHVAKLSAPGATGEGHEMALDAGGQLRDMENIRAAFGFIPNPSTVDDISQIIYAGAIIVNQQAHRFVDESKPYKAIGEIALDQPDQKCFLVFDEQMRQHQMKARSVERKLWEGIDRGQVPEYVMKGTSFSEIARKAKLDEEQFNRTLARYNNFARLGRDEDFGRVSLGSAYGRIKPISHPPFYIVPAVCGMMGTNCGILIDEHARVVDKAGKPISGLYAAGEMTGGFHGLGFMGGTSYGKALVFGRIAGESASRGTNP